MSRKESWEPMELVRVGHVGDVVRHDEILSPPADLSVDEIASASSLIDDVA